MSYRYEMPTDLDEAVALLNHYGQEAKLLAGGTDLIIQLQEEELKPKVIIDISRLAELRNIEQRNDSLLVGSLCTFSDVISSDHVNREAFALIQAAKLVGSPQIRNQGTLGGNLANGSPAADSVPALLSLESRVELTSADGKRETDLEELLGGVGYTKLRPGEIITYFRIPRKRKRYSSFAKLGRRNALAISRISAALSIVLKEGKISSAAVALGAVGPTPYRVGPVEEMLVGRQPAEKLWPEIEALLSEQVAEKLGSRASAPYKREAIKGVVSAAWEQLSATIREVD